MDANLLRCPWSDTDALYRHYHDTEWGVPCYDDHKLFEFLAVVDYGIAQAGQLPQGFFGF